MKVSYPLKTTVELKEIKELLKPYGGRCAKIVEDKIEYQIKEENKDEALNVLRKKELVE